MRFKKVRTSLRTYFCASEFVHSALPLMSKLVSSTRDTPLVVWHARASKLLLIVS